MDAIISVRRHLSYKMLEMEATFCDISASDTWKRENIFFMELSASSTHDNNSRFSALVQKKF
jgi:hypothetical protein